VRGKGRNEGKKRGWHQLRGVSGFEFNNEREMELLWMVGYIILGIVTLFFVALYFYATSVMVRPDECSSSTGAYGVLPGATGTTISLCGSDGTSPCSFNETSLTSAVEKCEELGPSVCVAFTYSEKTGEMNVVAPEVHPPPSTVTNLYRRRLFTSKIKTKVGTKGT